MIVGPPGTGKTDTAVQIISNLYHNYPTQKIVLVTHSNAALNDLFMKIMEVRYGIRHSDNNLSDHRTSAVCIERSLIQIYGF